MKSGYQITILVAACQALRVVDTLMRFRGPVYHLADCLQRCVGSITRVSQVAFAAAFLRGNLAVNPVIYTRMISSLMLGALSCVILVIDHGRRSGWILVSLLNTRVPVQTTMH